MAREIVITKREAERLIEGLSAVSQYYVPGSDPYVEIWALVRSLRAGFHTIKVSA